MVRLAKTYRHIIKLAVGLLLLSFLFYKVDFRSFVTSVRYAEYGYFFAGLALFGLMGVFETGRIYTALYEYSLSIFSSARLYLIGTFFSNFMPGNIGSEVYKVLYLNRIESGLKKPISLMFMLRLTALLALGFMACIYACINYQHVADILTTGRSIVGVDAGKYRLLVLLSAIVIAIVMVYLAAKGSHGVERIVSTIGDFVSALKGISVLRICTILCLSFLVHGVRILSFYCFIKALNQNILLPDLILVTAVTLFASLLPISFASLGIREGAITGSLFIMGLSKPDSMAVAVMSRLAIWIVSLIGGTIFLTGDSLHGWKTRIGNTD